MGSKFSFGGWTWVWVSLKFNLSSSKKFKICFIWVWSNTNSHNETCNIYWCRVILVKNYILYYIIHTQKLYLCIFSNLQKKIASSHQYFSRESNYLSIFLFQANRLGIDEFNQVELMSTMAMFDTMIIVWKEKRRWDAVRPFTAIKYLYGDNVR